MHSHLNNPVQRLIPDGAMCHRETRQGNGRLLEAMSCEQKPEQ